MTLYAGAKADTDDLPNGDDAYQRMKGLIETLSAYIEHYHGGALEFINFDGERLTIRMSGACRGCDLQKVTLHGWIEGTVRPFFPDVKEVIAVE
ncbi:MAG: NifU family protein [Chloroflexi bacterium]|jgi:Fe-S cluster biogenesis protein NfuA|nr:NifU family protein [Chloroflexota bacterium]